MQSETRSLPRLLPSDLKRGLYIDYAGNGEHGLYGLGKEDVPRFRTWLKVNGAKGLRVERSMVLGGAYVIYFQWEFYRRR